ncbi:MAG: Hpt domain-containing protein, partial [Campylobacterales bacterium]|nr:Hpt domain-containing protein [Campylobacterales bacterium]
MDELQEILQDFLVEAFEMIEQLDQDLVELEQRPEDLDLLNRIFRVAHTIKGSSSFLNFDVLTKLTHHMEDVLNKARHGELKITPEVMDVVLASIDQMKALLYSIRDTGTDAGSGIDIEPTVARLDAASSGKPIASAAPTAAAAPKEEPTPVAASNDPEPDYANMSAEEVEAEIERLLKQRQDEDEKRRQEKRANGESMPEVEAPHEVDEESAPAAAAPQPAPTPAPAAAPKPAAPAAPATNADGTPAAGGSTIEQTIRVDVNRLDHLMNLIGELVLGKNRLIKIYSDVEER